MLIVAARQLRNPVSFIVEVIAGDLPWATGFGPLIAMHPHKAVELIC